MTLNSREGHKRSLYSLNSWVIEGQFCNCYTTFSRQFPPYIDFLNNVHDFHLILYFLYKVFKSHKRSNICPY